MFSVLCFLFSVFCFLFSVFDFIFMSLASFLSKQSHFHFTSHIRWVEYFTSTSILQYANTPGGPIKSKVRIVCVRVQPERNPKTEQESIGKDMSGKKKDKNEKKKEMFWFTVVDEKGGEMVFGSQDKEERDRWVRVLSGGLVEDKVEVLIKENRMGKGTVLVDKNEKIGVVQKDGGLDIIQVVDKLEKLRDESKNGDRNKENVFTFEKSKFESVEIFADENFQNLFFRKDSKSMVELSRWIESFHLKASELTKILVEEYVLPPSCLTMQKCNKSLATGIAAPSEIEQQYYFDGDGMLLTFCHDALGVDDLEDEYQIKNNGLIINGVSGVMNHLDSGIFSCGYYCLVDYLGFRVKVAAVIRTKQMITYGCDYENNYYERNVAVEKEAARLARHLNLKEHEILWQNRVISSYFGLSLVVTTSYKAKEAPINEPQYYLHFHRSPFPLDGCQVNLDSGAWPVQRIREEFVIVQSKPLSASVFSKEASSAVLESNIDNEMLVLDTTSRLLKEIIPTFAARLLLSPVLNFQDLTRECHLYGINIRFLGLIYSHCVRYVGDYKNEVLRGSGYDSFRSFLLDRLESLGSLSVAHIREETTISSESQSIQNCKFVLAQILIEIIVRSAKSLLSGNLRKVMRLAKQEISSTHLEDVNMVKEELKAELKGGVADFFNLLLGDSEESNHFIVQSIAKRIKRKFNIEIDSKILLSVPKQRFFFPMQHHCNILLVQREYNFASDMPILMDDISFKTRIKPIKSVMARLIAFSKKLVQENALSFCASVRECMFA